MSIITLMAVSFAGYIFLPFQSHPSTFNVSLSSNSIQNCDNMVRGIDFINEEDSLIIILLL